MDSLGYKSKTQHDIAISCHWLSSMIRAAWFFCCSGMTWHDAAGPRDLWYPVAATQSMGRAQMDMARPHRSGVAVLQPLQSTALGLFWICIWIRNDMISFSSTTASNDDLYNKARCEGTHTNNHFWYDFKLRFLQVSRVSKLRFIADMGTGLHGMYPR